MNSELPKDYVPFKTLNICSNKLINGQVPLEIEGNIPFLIGKGEMPLLWLKLPISKSGWEYIVLKNQRKKDKKSKLSSHLISILESASERKVVVEYMGSIIISSVMHDSDSAEITHLDLRPFGLSIYGDSNGLTVGGQKLSRNTMENVHTMIGIGNA